MGGGRVKLNTYDKKFYYRLEILYNKFAPGLVAFLITLDNYFDLQNTLIHSFTYLCVPSILTLCHMYISRSVLKFCRLHRVLVNYILFNVLYRMWQEIPFLPQFNSIVWKTVYTLTFILGFLSFMYAYVTSNKNTTTKYNREYRCR